MDHQVINARVSAVIPDAGRVHGRVNASVNSDVSGRMVGFVERVTDYNHLKNLPSINGVVLRGDKTAQDLRLVPTDLSTFKDIDMSSVDGTLRSNTYVYVDDSNEGARMSLEQIKDMNTKILSVDSVEEADFNKLSVGDFIYEKVKENI